MSRSSISVSRYLAVTAACVLGATALFVVAFAYAPGPRPTRNDYLWAGEMRLAKERIAATERGPRLLVYGGSEVYFGVSARLLTDLTGVPSFNMGTHGNNGIGMVMNDALNVARSGDTVIVSIIPGQLFSEHALVTEQATALDRWLGGRFFRTGSMKERLLLLSSAGASDFLPNAPVTIDRRRGYWPLVPNGYGDVEPRISTEATRTALTTALAKGPPIQIGYAPPRPKTDRSVAGYLWPAPPFPSVGPAAAASIKRAIRLMEVNDIQVYFAMAPSAYANHPDTVRALENAVGRERMMNAASRLSVDLMFDTPFHPNAAGRELVTRALAQGICPHAACGTSAEH